MSASAPVSACARERVDLQRVSQALRAGTWASAHLSVHLDSSSSLQVFHSGTTIDQYENIITSGGRVLSIVAQGESFDKAFELAYDRLEKINYEGMHFRKDIGYQVRGILNK